MHGLFLIERLPKRQPEFPGTFVAIIEPLVKDEVEEVREHARRLVIGFEDGQ